MSGIGAWALWTVATTLGASLGVALNALAYQAVYSVVILVSAREDPSRAVAVAGSFALFITCVALAQGGALPLIQRRATRRAHNGATPDSAATATQRTVTSAAGSAPRPERRQGGDQPGWSPAATTHLGWRWALATLVALLLYYPLLLFGGQPPFDGLGLPTAAQPGLLNAAILYGALALLTLPIGALVGAAQGLALYGRRRWARVGQWRWLAVNTLAWGFAWPLGLLLGNAISFPASFAAAWAALACVTGVVVVRRVDARASADRRA